MAGRNEDCQRPPLAISKLWGINLLTPEPELLSTTLTWLGMHSGHSDIGGTVWYWERSGTFLQLFKSGDRQIKLDHIEAVIDHASFDEALADLESKSLDLTDDLVGVGDEHYTEALDWIEARYERVKLRNYGRGWCYSLFIEGHSTAGAGYELVYSPTEDRTPETPGVWGLQLATANAPEESNFWDVLGAPGGLVLTGQQVSITDGASPAAELERVLVTLPTASWDRLSKSAPPEGTVFRDDFGPVMEVYSTDLLIEVRGV